jgi:hypothetical protein
MFGSQDGSGSDGWEPSVKYLLVLLIAEIIVFGMLRAFTVHGG